MNATAMAPEDNDETIGADEGEASGQVAAPTRSDDDEILEPEPDEEPSAQGERFYVTDGQATVGPVDGDLLSRGVTGGKVPLDAMVWCGGWERWRTVREYAKDKGILPVEQTALATSKLARVSDLAPLQLPATDEQRQTLEQTRSLNEAAALVLSLCSAITGAECGWVHVWARDAGGAMMTLEGIGPRAAFGVGRTIDSSDQALRAAREGRTVLAEPIPGVVGSAVMARVLATGLAPTGVLMVPVLAAGQLVAMIELGIASRLSGFTARHAAVCEQVARDLGTIARKRGWHRAPR